MTDLLAIVGPSEQDDRLLEEVAMRHPDRVTVLIEDASADPAGTRLSRLLRAIEQRTGAVVVGFVRDRRQLRGWRFDKVVRGRPRRGPRRPSKDRLSSLRPRPAG
jgi:hypothetical protein